MSYTHLCPEERYYIEIELKKGTSQNKIAEALERSQSNISREIKRNTGQRGYRHKQAEDFAQERHKNKPKEVKLTDEIKGIVNVRIEDDWSPEQIAGRLKQEGIISLHHETIYQHILADKKAGGELYKHLRHQNKTYRKRYGSAHNRTGIPNRVDIDERPEEVNNRKRIGGWEADTIIGKNHKGAIVTLDERVSKLRLAFPLAGKKAQYVLDATILMLDPIKSFVKTITFDNGKEFTLHEKIAEALGCDTYFATPYSSWERGQNENANGLLRQYFPKVMELIDVTIKEVFIAVDKLNSRPKKCLNYKTPYEVFEELTGIDMKNLLGYVLMT
ncbi:transposase, IS30 family [Bathymodiolus japonicus methanotrophic gill symbiont]|nr:IS30 family transposase [Bathymodiolus japonicus methanotrophic gill symbiont]GFO71016.1 transposase, IS30 family [Bathymodiolus japonicus methanotrophic gill symbiont]GFO71148.1 transposase, IS30 family [Bathymodiolus japonicus methanotrophic gill symbiont]